MVSQFTAEDVKIGYINANHFPRMIEMEHKSFQEPLDELDFRVYLSQPNNVGRTIECQGNFVGFFIHKKNKPLITRIAINSEYQVPEVTDKQALVAVDPQSHLEDVKRIDAFDIEVNAEPVASVRPMACTLEAEPIVLPETERAP